MLGLKVFGKFRLAGLTLIYIYMRILDGSMNCDCAWMGEVISIVRHIVRRCWLSVDISCVLSVGLSTR